MKIKLTTLLTLLLGTMLFAQDGWQTYEKDNYSIKFPTNWEYSGIKPQPLIAFMLFSPEASEENDKFREKVNLTIEELSKADYTLDEYTNLMLDEVKKQIPSAKMINALPTTIGNIQATNIVWSADFGNDIVLQFNQLFAIKDRIAYVLTFTSTTTEYDLYAKDAIKILNSFKFTK